MQKYFCSVVKCPLAVIVIMATEVAAPVGALIVAFAIGSSAIALQQAPSETGRFNANESVSGGN